MGRPGPTATPAGGQQRLRSCLTDSGFGGAFVDSGPVPARRGETQQVNVCPGSTFKVSWKVGSTVFLWTPVLRLPWADRSGSR